VPLHTQPHDISIGRRAAPATWAGRQVLQCTGLAAPSLHYCPCDSNHTSHGAINASREAAGRHAFQCPVLSCSLCTRQHICTTHEGRTHTAPRGDGRQRAAEREKARTLWQQRVPQATGMCCNAKAAAHRASVQAGMVLQCWPDQLRSRAHAHTDTQREREGKVRTKASAAAQPAHAAAQQHTDPCTAAGQQSKGGARASQRRPAAQAAPTREQARRTHDGMRCWRPGSQQTHNTRARGRAGLTCRRRRRQRRAPPPAEGQSARAHAAASIRQARQLTASARR
jgi:hypothetical protein